MVAEKGPDRGSVPLGLFDLDDDTPHCQVRAGCYWGGQDLQEILTGGYAGEKVRLCQVLDYVQGAGRGRHQG